MIRVPRRPRRPTPCTTVTPAVTTTYDLEVRCSLSPACVAADPVTLVVYPVPLAAAGPDRSGCAGASYALTGSAAAPPPCAPLEYRWLDGATVVQSWSASPTVTVAVPTDSR